MVIYQALLALIATASNSFPKTKETRVVELLSSEYGFERSITLEKDEKDSFCKQFADCMLEYFPDQSRGYFECENINLSDAPKFQGVWMHNDMTDTLTINIVDQMEKIPKWIMRKEDKKLFLLSFVYKNSLTYADLKDPYSAEKIFINVKSQDPFELEKDTAFDFGSTKFMDVKEELLLLAEQEKKIMDVQKETMPPHGMNPTERPFRFSENTSHVAKEIKSFDIHNLKKR